MTVPVLPVAAEPVMSVRDLGKHYRVGGGFLDQPARLVRAVDGVTLDIRAHETFALVGESGCGKTTLGRVMLRLQEPTTGSIHYRGTDLTTLALAERLRQWQEAADPVAIVIGGPDGIDPTLAGQADETLRLSSLTLPHALARVLLAEQLYRAWSVLTNHPYHRA